MLVQTSLLIMLVAIGVIVFIGIGDNTDIGLPTPEPQAEVATSSKKMIKIRNMVCHIAMWRSVFMRCFILWHIRATAQ
jgi:hypothetical protein